MRAPPALGRSRTNVSKRRVPADQAAFEGFAPPTSSTTFTPNQFFDVCLPHYPRGVVRLVAFLIRKTLGWCDRDGNPQEEQIQFSYTDLIEAGISRDMIRGSLDEAAKANFIECVRSGEAHVANKAGARSIYQLRWSSNAVYLKRPEEFQGFFEAEGNRTDIPNQFFDVVIPLEPLSVIKVVGAIIRFSIGFVARHGRRRQQVSLSYDEIQRYTKIGSRDDLARALRTAQERKYVVRLEKGIFSPLGDIRRKATYALRWADFPIGQKSEPDIEQSEIRTSNGQKSEPADQSEIRTSIQTTLENETIKQQQGEVADPEIAKALLKGEGFSERVAAKLAKEFTVDQVEQQIQWVGDRFPSRNRLGLLRRAIEQNWSAPEKLRISEVAQTPEYSFARHFYAGFAGNHGEPISEPSPREVSSSIALVERLLSLKDDPDQIPRWGRALGKLARQQRNPFPSLQLALRQLGDEFFAREVDASKDAIAELQEQQRFTRVATLGPLYQEFLRAQELRYQLDCLEEYNRFLDHRNSQRAELQTCTLPWNSGRWLELFDTENRRLVDFQRYFDLPDFQQWEVSLEQKPRNSQNS